MEKYDYYRAVTDDVKEYIKENDIEVTEENREELQDRLYDELFVEDSVTGNASGSYTFSTYQAEMNLVGNTDLLHSALMAFAELDVDILEKGAEWCDVTIRCYILNACIYDAIDEILDEE